MKNPSDCKSRKIFHALNHSLNVLQALKIRDIFSPFPQNRFEEVRIHFLKGEYIGFMDSSSSTKIPNLNLFKRRGIVGKIGGPHHNFASYLISQLNKQIYTICGSKKEAEECLQGKIRANTCNLYKG